MFVRNATTCRPVLARGYVTETLAVAAIVVETAYAIGPSGALTRLEAPRERAPSDPPDITDQPLWKGVSVTAAGEVHGPASPPFVRSVSLSVGSETRRLSVFGPRRFRPRAGGGLSPSDPERFDRVPLSFQQAFGGAYDLPPGIEPGTNLPHPGGRVIFALNERGTGFHPSEQAAAGQPLPAIEDPAQLIEQWSDRPEPAGFSPCPELVALRLPRTPIPLRLDLAPAEQIRAIRSEADKGALLSGLRMIHHAPPALIFPSIAPGTAIELHGVGRRSLRIAAPPSPLRVQTRPPQPERAVEASLRSLHLDAGAEILLAVHAHAFRYEGKAAPRWIHVEAA
jgi:hypothetical protein